MRKLRPPARAWSGLLVSIPIALLAVVGAGTQAAAAPATGTLAVSALAFTPTKIDAAAGGAGVTVSWTITNSNTAATGQGGDLYIRMQGDEPNTYIGQTYDVQFAYQNSIYGQASYVGGTPQAASYTYTFGVPRYANLPNARWVVTEIAAGDERGGSLDAQGASLDQFPRVLSASESVDSTAPTYQSLSLVSNNPVTRPYVYDNGVSNIVQFSLTVQDQQSGFWRGSMELTGPDGATLSAGFEYRTYQGQPECGLYVGGDDRDMNCNVIMTIPAGTAAGTWSVSEVSLTDNAGNTKNYGHLNLLPIVVTANGVLSATGFSASPNPVNDWARSQTVQLTFGVVGAQQGISAVYVDAGGATGGICPQISTTPTVNADGTVSIPMLVNQGTLSCRINGVAIVDGVGNVALYGSEYGAPDPGVTITQLPDTTPPTVTSASLSTTTIPASKISSTQVSATATVVTPVAPVTQFSTTVYDSFGNVAAAGGQRAVNFGSTWQSADNTVYLGIYLPYGLAPGTYTIGFTITDAGRLTTSYGMPGTQPVPGGPLTITVTAS